MVESQSISLFLLLANLLYFPIATFAFVRSRNNVALLVCNSRSVLVPKTRVEDHHATATSPDNRPLLSDVVSKKHSKNNQILNAYSKIKKGQIYVQDDFLTPDQIEALRQDIQQLQRRRTHAGTTTTTTTTTAFFQPSGLSNRVEGDENIFGASDRMCCTITPDLPETEFSNMRYVVEEKLEQLKIDLEEVLRLEELELAEMYYSSSPKGSSLPLHQDERHEDTKGKKGWMNDTRRSISWLIYLNHNGWEASTTSSSSAKAGSGGELRAYCRPCFPDQNMIYCGSHEGDLQVGWLRSSSLDLSSSSKETIFDFEPIFLDSWIKTPAPKISDEDEVVGEYDQLLQWKPMSALYRIQRDANSQEKTTEELVREYLSAPFGPHSSSWPSAIDFDPVDFSKALELQLSKEDHQRQFVGVEDIHVWREESMMNVVDVVPTGGALVLFDSVTVPHEVLKVTSGTRLAIAGWFHEQQQEYPDWYGT